MATFTEVVGFPCLDSIVQKYYILTATIRLAILNKSFAFIKLSLRHMPLHREVALAVLIISIILKV